MLKKSLFSILTATALTATVCASSLAQAGLVIAGTRFIYPGHEKAISVGISNPSTNPGLAQTWLEQGEPSAANQKVPFIITPPLARVDANGRLDLRVRHTGESLPQDRESLFYLNVLDIPAKPKDADTQNYLQFTFKNRLKFFYRPSNLPYSVEKAYSKVVWQLADGKMTILNNTSYYITYVGFSLQKGDEAIKDSFTEADMVAPFSQEIIEVKSDTEGADTVQWHLINDFGGTSSGTSALQK